MRKKIHIDLGCGERLNCDNLMLAVVSDGNDRFAIRAFTKVSPSCANHGVVPVPGAERMDLPVVDLKDCGTSMSFATFEMCRGAEIPLHDMALFLCEQRAKLEKAVGSLKFAEIDSCLCRVMRKYV